MMGTAFEKNRIYKIITIITFTAAISANNVLIAAVLMKLK